MRIGEIIRRKYGLRPGETPAQFVADLGHYRSIRLRVQKRARQNLAPVDHEASFDPHAREA